MPSSAPPPEARPAALAQFVQDLRALGLEVGVDDALRLGRLFAQADGWSHGRRVRALKAILGRTEEERRRIEEISSLLFPDAPQDPREDAPRPAERYPEGARPPAPLRPVPGAPQPAEAGPAAARSRFRKLATAATAAFALLAALLVVEHRNTPPPPRPEPEASQETPTQESPSTGQQPGDSPQPEPRGSAGSTPVPPIEDLPLPLPMQTAADQAVDCDVLPVPHAPWRPFLSLFVAALLVHAFYGWQAFASGRLLKRVDASRQGLLDSTGSRSYQVHPTDPSEPLDVERLRDAAFALAAPGALSLEQRLDAEATIEATARAAGRLELRLRHEKDQGTILLLEDIQTPAELWPDHGTQLLRALERQGGRPRRYYFLGNPERVSEGRALRHEHKLEDLLAELQPHFVLVVTAASWFDGAAEEDRQRALRPLPNALWLHPRPRELWDAGARWLAKRVRLAPLGEPERLRPGAYALPSEPLPPRWTKLEPLHSGFEAELHLLRYALGDAYPWLAAGALLAEQGALTTRAWWLLRADFARHGQLPVPLDLAERVWELPWVTVGSSGAVAIHEEPRRLLAAQLEAEWPELYARTLAKLEGWIDQDLRRLEGRGETATQPSLGWLLAKLARGRARQAAPSAAIRKQGEQELRELAEQGYEVWVTKAVPRFQDGAVRRFLAGLLPAPPTWLTAVATGAIALELALLPLLASDALRRELFPLEPSIQFLTQQSPPLLSPNYPIRVCDRYQQLETFETRLGQFGVEVQEGRDSKGAIVWDITPSPAGLPDLFYAGLRLDQPQPPALELRQGGWSSGPRALRLALDDRLERFAAGLIEHQHGGGSFGDIQLDVSQVPAEEFVYDEPWILVASEGVNRTQVSLWDPSARRAYFEKRLSDSLRDPAPIRIDGEGLPGAPANSNSLLRSLSLSLTEAFSNDEPPPKFLPSANAQVLVLVLSSRATSGYALARFSLPPAPLEQATDGASLANGTALPPATRWTYYESPVLEFASTGSTDIYRALGLPQGLSTEFIVAPPRFAQTLALRSDAQAVANTDPTLPSRRYLRITGVADEAGTFELELALDNRQRGAESFKLRLEVRDPPGGNADLLGKVGQEMAFSISTLSGLVPTEPWSGFPPELSQPFPGKFFGKPSFPGDWIAVARGRDGDPIRAHIRIRPRGCNGATEDYCGGQCVDTATDPFHWGGCFQIHPDLTREAAAKGGEGPSLEDFLLTPELAARELKLPVPPVTYLRPFYRWSTDLNTVEAWSLATDSEGAADTRLTSADIPRRKPSDPTYFATGEITWGCSRRLVGDATALRTQDRPAFAWNPDRQRWEQLPVMDWTRTSLIEDAPALDEWLRQVLTRPRGCRQV